MSQPATPAEFPAVDLSPEALMAAAEEATGLHDWGDGIFREPLAVYLRALEETGGLSRQGRFLFHRTALRLLGNRLRIERDLREDPSILDTPVPRPLFVLGLPRTGTTLLHKLLACDPRARYIRLCEGLHPSPPPDPATWETDPRIAETEAYLQAIKALAPDLDKAHELVATGAEECLWLFEHSFADFIHELRADVPAFTAWVESREGDPAYYRDFRRMVQLLGSRWPGDHWVFKAPRHLMGLAGLLAVFPEARIAWTHRDPAEVLPSLCSLCYIDRRIFAEEDPDRAGIGAFWLERVSSAMGRALAVRDDDAREHPGRWVDIDYRVLVADPVAAVEGLYEAHGYPFSGEFADAMRAWLDANRQHKHGRHEYRAEDYGLDRSGIRDAFADYCRRFSL